MSMQSVGKVFASVTLSLLAVYHTNPDNVHCRDAPPLTNPKRDGYSRLIQDLKNHVIIKDKIPPGVTLSYQDGHRDDLNTEAVNVSIQLMPVDILELDPIQQVLEMSVYVGLIWEDKNLAWNVSEYGGVEVVEMPSSEIWIPKITVLNGVKDAQLIPDESIPFSLNFMGYIFLSFSVRLRTSCSLDLTFFPFDKQICRMTLASTSLLGVHTKPAFYDVSSVLRKFSISGEWDLTHINFTAVPGFGHLQRIQNTLVTVQLRRRRMFYVMSMEIPMSLFTFMNCLVFLIPPECGEKVSFVVSIFISNAIFTSFVSGVMPRGLDWRSEVPLMMVYLAFMWIWSTLTLLATAYVINKSRAEQTDNSRRRKAAGISPSQSQRESNLTKLAVKSSLSKRRSKFMNRHRVAACDDDNGCISVMDLVHSSMPGHALETDSTSLPPQPEASDGGLGEPEKRGVVGGKAKSLDRIFLVLSVLIVVIIHVIFCMIFYIFI